MIYAKCANMQLQYTSQNVPVGQSVVRPQQKCARSDLSVLYFYRILYWPFVRPAIAEHLVYTEGADLELA